MLFVSTLALAVAAASAQPKPTALPTLAPAYVKLAMPSFTQKHAEISVKVNQPFQLRMTVNGGTGYSWQPQGPIPPGMTLLGVFQRQSSRMMPGGPAEEVLVFRGHDVGKMRLVLEYVRPWERNAKPAKVAAFTITVHK